MIKQRSNWATRCIEVLPVALPAALAAFGTVAVALLLFGQLHSAFVGPLGLLAAVCVFMAVARAPRIERPGGRREQMLCDVMVVFAIVAWGLFNAYHASEHVFTNRDPATYANAAAWLVDHESLRIDTPSVFDQHNIVSDSPGFMHPANRPAEVHAQGAHLLPVLLGLGGRVVGEELMLRLSPLFGMSALLAVYGFARLVVRPRWALVGTAALALSLPMLYFSRDSYTEPLSMTFVFAGLALLWAAQKTARSSLWLVAGLVAGAGALTRIDSYIVVAGMAAALAVYVAVSIKAERRAKLRYVALFIGGMLVPSVVGWLDITMLSVPYYEAHKSLLTQELLALAGVIAAGCIGIAISWRSGFVQWLDKATKTWRAPALVLLVCVAAAVLVSRPLWLTTYNATGVTAPYYAAIQAAEGAEPSPRTYTELTTYWITWYVGPLLGLMGVAGLAITAARATKRSGMVLVAFVFVLAITALLYLLKPSVAPDQVWAARRMLPVVIPGLIICAVIGLQKAVELMRVPQVTKRVFMGLTMVAAVAGPLVVSLPFLQIRDTVQRPLFSGLCQALPAKAAVLWLGEGRAYNVQATRSYCNVPTAAYAPKIFSTDDLARAATQAQKAGYTPVVAVFAGDMHLLKSSQAALTKVSEHGYAEMELRLTGPPQKYTTKQYQFYLGRLQPDGSVQKL